MTEIFLKLAEFGIANIEVDLNFLHYSQKLTYCKYSTYQFTLPYKLEKKQMDELFLLQSVIGLEQLAAKDNRTYLLVSVC